MLETLMFSLYIFGSPILGLIILVKIASFFFRKGKKQQSQNCFTIALSLCIAGLVAVGVIVCFCVSIFNTGGLAILALLALPIIGLVTLLGMLPFAWAFITMYFVALNRFRPLSNTSESYGRFRIISSALIVVIYIIVGAFLWRQHWEHNLLYDETASSKDVMSVYGNGKWRKKCPNGNGLVALMQRSHCPVEIISELVVHENFEIRQFVALSRKTPVYSLEILANDQNPWVRKSLISNKRSTPEILRKVAETEFQKFPTEIFIYNPNTPTDVLAKLNLQEILASDSMRKYLAKHPNIPPKMAVAILTQNDSIAKRELAKNPSCPVDIIIQLAEDPDAVSAIVDNPSTPLSIMETIAQRNDSLGKYVRRKLSREKNKQN